MTGDRRAGVDSATAPYRLRFDECSPVGAARAGAYMRLAQDMAWFHSEQLGFDRSWYVARGMAWFARSAELTIVEPSGSSDVLAVTTRVMGFRRVWARRRTEFRVGPSGGRLVAWADTDWVMTDARGMPSRVPPEIVERFRIGVSAFEPTRVALPDPPTEPGLSAELRFAVRRHELDPLGHANNAAYLDWVDEAAVTIGSALVDAVPRRYRLEYLLPAGPGAELTATAWSIGDVVACILRDGAGRACLRATVGLAPGHAAPGPGESAPGEFDSAEDSGSVAEEPTLCPADSGSSAGAPAPAIGEPSPPAG